MKKVLLALFLAMGFTVAQAQVTANIDVTTDYRFRGISQTLKSGAVQGGLDYAHSSGLYIGNWNSSVSTAEYTDSTGLESDLYAGFKKEIVKGTTIDVGSYNYYYSQADSKYSSQSNTHEFYAAATQGPITVRYNQSIGNYFGATRSAASKYIQADVTLPVAAKINLVAHAGRTLVQNHSTSNYTDLNAGATYDVAGVTVGARYYKNMSLTTAAKAADTVSNQKLYKDAVVFSVAKLF